MESLYLHPDLPADDQGFRPHLVPVLHRDATLRPLVIVCPGGGYGHRANHEGVEVARWLHELGLHAAVLHYRVKPHRHPAPLHDAQRAIRLVRHHATTWRVDPARILILGFSAGGHLAASATTIHDGGDPGASDPVARQSCRPDGAILCYPVITLGEHRHDGSRRNLLGDTPDPALVESLSLETRVDARTPPCFLWHTADDGAVPVQNSLLFASALARHRVPHALHVFAHGRHGLGLAQDHPEARAWTGLCATWLRAMGFAAD